MNKILLGLAASTLFVASSANATLIDDFSDGDLFLNSLGSVVDDFQDGLTGVIGGSRYVSLVASGVNTTTVINLDPNAGAYVQNDGVGVNSAGLIIWSGADDDNSGLGDGLGGIDLTGDSFALDFESIDQGSVEFQITVSDTDSVSSFLVTTGTLGMNYYSFASFTGSANFDSVDSISLLVSTTAVDGDASDLKLASIATVPEPSVLALLGTGLLGLGFARRRMKK